MILASLLLALSGGVTVQLPEKVDCQGVNLRLGDVARVSSDDEALLEKVKELELGYMPAPSFSRLLHRAQLQAALAKEFPDVTFKFAGVDRTRVYPKTQVVTGATIEAAAKAVVEKRFAGQDVDLALRDHLNDLTVPLGRESLEVKRGSIKRPFRPNHSLA